MNVKVDVQTTVTVCDACPKRTTKPDRPGKSAKSGSNSSGYGLFAVCVAVIVLAATYAICTVDWAIVMPALVQITAILVGGGVVCYLCLLLFCWRWSNSNHSTQARPPISASAGELPLETQQLLGVTRRPTLNGKPWREEQPRVTVIGLPLPLKNKYEPK